jgi:drug/metabolite transporter (DMT)-like permease
VVAAVAAYVLAGETLRVRDWIGGGLIMAATLASALAGSDRPADQKT